LGKTKPVPGYKGIIFDLDGTLLDTLQDIADSMNAVLKAAGYPERPLDNYRYYVGEGITPLVRNALEDIVRPEKEILFLAEEMESLYRLNYAKQTKPYEGIGELLGLLCNMPLRLGVLSNKPDAFTKKMVELYFPETCFETVRGAQAGVPKKPDPSAALAVADQWALNPAEILFVGDSRIDMETAVNAGMAAVGVLWGFRDETELRQYGADYILRSPAELMDIL
jgi:phosphoglycolate phosphatase